MQFFITCAARTGSTMLRYLLNSHPQILCHGEVFKRKGWQRHFQKKKITFKGDDANRSLIDLFDQLPIDVFIKDHLLSITQKQQKAVGFKFKTDEYFDPSFSSVSKCLQENHQIKVIHLRRKNLLAQYVSHLYVINKQLPTVIFKGDNVAPQDQIKIDKKEFLEFCDDVTSRESLIAVEMNQHDSYPIWYEDIVEDVAQLNDVLEFLNIAPHPLESRTKKIIPNYSDLILNIDDVLQWMKNSKYEGRVTTNKSI